MQGTQVQALVREDPTCRGATKPVCHNYWAGALEPASHNYWACAPQLLKPTRLKPVLCDKRSHLNEKPAHSNEGPTQRKINKFIKKNYHPKLSSSLSRDGFNWSPFSRGCSFKMQGLQKYQWTRGLRWAYAAKTSISRGSLSLYMSMENQLLSPQSILIQSQKPRENPWKLQTSVFRKL